MRKIKTTNNMSAADIKAEIQKMKGSLGNEAMYQLWRLVQAGDLKAISLALSMPELKNKPIADIYKGYLTTKGIV